MERLVDPLTTIDAKLWADEFMKVKARLGAQEFDHAMMLGWFANAIMQGYDEGQRRAKADAQAAVDLAKAEGAAEVRKVIRQRLIDVRQARSVARLSFAQDEYDAQISAFESILKQCEEPFSSNNENGLDLQATVEALRAASGYADILAKYVWSETGEFCMPDGTYFEVNKGSSYEDLRAQVEALQRELESANALLHKKNCAIGKAEMAIEALQQGHSQLQALVRALVGTKSFTINGPDIRTMSGNVLYACSSQTSAERLGALLEYRERTLDATTPAGGGQK